MQLLLKKTASRSETIREGRDRKKVVIPRAIQNYKVKKEGG